ncbi:hypothetical protein Y032_0224g2700 [Ancylostoma ceylanicum]|uniref:Uncharacterized protein n=1 Tax=Ancylostoma ceylanicum TaxID=53326 RepID=A0A016SHC3_9BILA|nr:hypothetical protein Y032_0224g2700 [Ancylostoma ceylanicum]
MPGGRSSPDGLRVRSMDGLVAVGALNGRDSVGYLDDAGGDETKIPVAMSLTGEKCRVPKSSCYVSFDAVSLYTNIDNNAAVKTLLELLNNRKEVTLFGFSDSDIEILLEAALACNIFCFNNIFYA